ncbi:hypothetical protein K458DRAFT_154806 [Lentithecium fluviatile CBS 122367]|uniref:Uncharacterized protein n=1 Tax=Lentithecium fluviatile CBS 122367 TaxID=1168545 RepID=A0A6G1JFL8_9PLEO|nr:hypothetical protein K458DRAFT_154806 [Lentithecium fluviatile CBS 122367]
MSILQPARRRIPGFLVLMWLHNCNFSEMPREGNSCSAASLPLLRTLEEILDEDVTDLRIDALIGNALASSRRRLITKSYLFLRRYRILIDFSMFWREFQDVTGRAGRRHSKRVSCSKLYSSTGRLCRALSQPNLGGSWAFMMAHNPFLAIQNLVTLVRNGQHMGAHRYQAEQALPIVADTTKIPDQCRCYLVIIFSSGHLSPPPLAIL